MDIHKAISVRILGLIKENDLTQYQLSLDSLVPQSTISTIVNLRKSTFEIQTIAQMIQHLGVSVREFFNNDLFDKENIDIIVK